MPYVRIWEIHSSSVTLGPEKLLDNKDKPNI